MEELPYLTAEVPAIRARYKASPEDFRVEEIPAYPPSGEGTHVHLRIEKRDLATSVAVRRIARELGLRPHDVGYAGMKDARAVTEQTLSVEHVPLERVRACAVPGVRVLAAERHRNRIRRGHLAGNRFAIRLREVDPGRVADVRAVLDALGRRGVPNYFGPQRFGRRGDAWRIGEAFLREDWSEAVRLLAGSPSDFDTGDALRARRQFDAGRYGRSAQLWPDDLHEPKRIAAAMARFRGDAQRAARILGRREWGFFVSAWQSRLFNRVLAARMDWEEAGIDALAAGDLAWKHDSGAVFAVDDPAEAAGRAARFEVSPSGPLPGPRMPRPTGRPGALEERVLRETLGGDALEEPLARAGTRGTRRALRFPVEELDCDFGDDEAGPHLELRFRLGRGCYATALLRELGKGELRLGSPARAGSP